VVAGDLGKTRFGLKEDEYEALCGAIDLVYHCGAAVNFLSSYEALKPANVLGTEEVLRLCVNKGTKPLHYLSTLSVFSPSGSLQFKRFSEDSEPDEPPSVGGYPQSKWVAEKKLWIAKSRGIPVSIYRLGRVFGHSQSGAAPAGDFMQRVMTSCVQMGAGPKSRFKVLDLLPVDHVAQAIIRLSEQPEVLGKNFHIFNHRRISLNDLLEGISSYGYPVRRLSMEKWKQELEKTLLQDWQNSLAPMLPLLLLDKGITQPAGIEIFSFKPTQRQLKLVGLEFSEVDHQLIHTNLAYLVRSNLVAPPVSLKGEER